MTERSQAVALAADAITDEVAPSPPPPAPTPVVREQCDKNPYCLYGKGHDGACDELL
jgi:hypothetical protein